MNAIIRMNHSPKMQEPDSQPLRRERDIFALHAELVDLTGDEHARRFGLSLSGLGYEQKCLAYRHEIAEQTPLAYAEAICAAYDLDQPHDPELGTRVIVSGGEMLELPDAHLESAYDDRNGDGYDF